MTPLLVTAHLMGPVCMPHAPIALDALLGAAVCQRDAIPPAATVGELVSLDIPIARESGGRFYLATCAVTKGGAVSLEYTQRRFPMAQAQMLGRGIRSIQINGGPSRNFRLPREVIHLEDDRLDWYAIGDLDGVRDLLMWVTHLGHRRAVGLGRVARWTVEPCEPWGDGFPILRDGVPLRSLPADYPGVAEDWPRVMGVVDMPYWVLERSEPCVQPAW